MKPSTDLCWTCQRNSMLLGRLANLSEEEKLAKINQAQQHIRHATTERAFYNDAVQKAKDAVKDKQPPVRLHEPGHGVHDCSVDMMSHYSFDFAQQLHFPSNPQQPGPIYLKTPRKCGVFGVVAEAIPQMVLFLLDEAVDTGKGANTVISMLDFFFENFSLKETECHLHADNCTGQNKNKAMLHYLLWRVMTKRHKKITLSFLVAGHTKFSPDRCFGLFKRTFRRAKVDCLNDIVAWKWLDDHQNLASSDLTCVVLRMALRLFLCATGMDTWTHGSGSWWDSNATTTLNSLSQGKFMCG